MSQTLPEDHAQERPGRGSSAVIERVVAPLFLLTLAAVFTLLGLAAASDGAPRTRTVLWWVLVALAVASLQVRRVRRGDLVLRRGGGSSSTDDVEWFGWLLLGLMLAGVVVPWDPARAVCLTAVGAALTVWTSVGMWVAWIVRPGHGAGGPR